MNAIIRWAKNKTAREMSSRKITFKINSLLALKKEKDKKDKLIQVSQKTVNNYLKEFYGKPKSLSKVFFLSDDKEKRR